MRKFLLAGLVFVISSMCSTAHAKLLFSSEVGVDYGSSFILDYDDNAEEDIILEFGVSRGTISWDKDVEEFNVSHSVNLRFGASLGGDITFAPLTTITGLMDVQLTDVPVIANVSATGDTLGEILTDLDDVLAGVGDTTQIEADVATNSAAIQQLEQDVVKLKSDPQIFFPDFAGKAIKSFGNSVGVLDVFESPFHHYYWMTEEDTVQQIEISVPVAVPSTYVSGAEFDFTTNFKTTTANTADAALNIAVVNKTQGGVVVDFSGAIADLTSNDTLLAQTVTYTGSAINSGDILYYTFNMSSSGALNSVELHEFILQY